MDKLQGQNIPVIISLGTAVMVLLIVSIGLFVAAHQRRILKEKQLRTQQELEFQSRMIKLQLESQEQERRRIGADLHDSLGSLLWGAKVNVSVIQRVAPMNEESRTAFHELNQILDEGAQAVKRIAWELTPEAFQYSGLSASIGKLCERFDGKGLRINFRENDQRPPWNDDRALQVFRIVQELISNSIKHSGASVIELSLAWLDHDIQITFCDNGTGFELAETRKGVGLWNIDQRIKQLNGEIKIGRPASGTGFEANLKIPLAMEST